MEERRLIVAIALSLLVLTAYQLFFAPPPKPPEAVASPTPAGPSPAPRPAPSASPAAPVAPVATVADVRERRIEVEGSEVSVAFTNRGARLVSWRLLRFKDGSGRPEEIIDVAPTGPRPLDVETGDAALDARLREALFQPSAASVVLPASGAGRLEFAFSDGELEASKDFRFDAPGYLIGVEVHVKRAGRELPARLVWGPGVGNPTPEEKAVQGYQPPHAVFLDGGNVERLPAEKLVAPRAVPEVRWVGVESRYFAALLMPGSGTGPAEVRAVTLAPGADGKPRVAPEALLSLPADGTALVFVGPKDHQLMSRLGHDLARVVPIGDWLGPIVVPLMALLRFIHGHVGNYGWSIVGLTLLINLALSPLRHYSIANSAKMAKLAPEMRVIQERYRKVPALDPRRQEMQSEVAALYARHGMSMGSQMLAGCLPLLLTLPFLYALYRVLQISIELRGAPFLWIPDLSQKDPLFLTPVLLGITMFAMQRMTPSAMDPAQQRVMMIMPLMLVVMFFAAPAGLNLYWLSSNLCSIVQQGVTLRLIRPADAEGRKEKGRKR